ncbi:type II toxin-antitoxin system RelE/ParE family toxin [Roseovarius sp. D22-M7]|uniref:type II toxin-antitoxin system RelE/ParE family toxin n=1 Tax=Roseovarius sp. D22-M7 TaxID=3127116 RepID=UPI003FA7768F
MRDKAKPVVPRQAASKDIAEAVDHLAREAGLDAALRFIDALEVAYLHISTHPASGSPWIGWELGRPGLRVWPVKGFGYLAFWSLLDLCGLPGSPKLERALYFVRPVGASGA